MIHADELADDIVQKRTRELEKKITRYPRRTTYLSGIGDCDRELVYNVLDWKERPLHNAELQARFDVGNLWEREIIRELEGIGFTIILSQQPVEVYGRGGSLIASGRIDGFIATSHREKIPFEIKSMHPQIFNQINSVKDLEKKPWLRKYVRQLQMYLFGNNLEEGLFIFCDCLGHWKIFPVYLDYGACEWILQRLERVNEHIQKKTYPKRIPYDPQLCDKCAFSTKCLQDVINKPAELIDNEEFEKDLDRHEELKPLAKEYKDVHDKIKKSTKGVEKIIVGSRYLIQNLPSERTTYDLTDEIKEQIETIKRGCASKVPVTRLSIKCLG